MIDKGRFDNNNCMYVSSVSLVDDETTIRDNSDTAIRCHSIFFYRLVNANREL